MPTITFKPVVIPEQRRSDGTYNVKIRVTFKRKVRKLATSIDCKASDLTRNGKIKSGNILNATDKIIGDMRTSAAKLSPFALESMDVDSVLTYIKNDLNNATPFRLDFIAFVHGQAEKKTHPSTRQYYHNSAELLARFAGIDELDVSKITTQMINEFADYLRGRVVSGSKGKGAGAANNIARLRSCWHAAQLLYNDDDVVRIPRDPFARVSVERAPSSGQRSLGVELMQTIINAQTDSPTERYALDMFVLSFGCMGANVADLQEATPPVGGVWDYKRKKVRGKRGEAARMRVHIDARLTPYIERLRDPSGRKWLRLYPNAHQTSDAINRGLRSWAERNGFDTFTFYAARKTFASVAYSVAHIDKAVIDGCLTHVGDYKIADIYIERDFNVLNEALTKVMDIFTW